MTTTLLNCQFDFNQLLIARGLEDVTHEESLRCPEIEGNCINWITGHIITTRANLEAMLGAETYWSREQCEPYIPGKPFNAAHAWRLVDLREAVSESLFHLQKAINDTENRIDEQTGERGRTLGEQIATFVCHEAYHAGQIHMIRRTFGKPGLFG